MLIAGIRGRIPSVRRLRSFCAPKTMADMEGFLHTLRSGDWLTLERVRLWAFAVLFAAAGGLVYLVVTSDGLIDYQGRPLGTDFSNVYAAGPYVLEGYPAAPFDPRLQHAREQAIFGASAPFYGWHYPPFFLGVAATLALMPYQLALIVWQGVTLLLYLLAIRAIIEASSWPGIARQDGRERPYARPSTTSPGTSPQDVDARHKAGHDRVWLLFA